MEKEQLESLDKKASQKRIFICLFLLFVLLPIPQIFKPRLSDTIILQSTILKCFMLILLVCFMLNVYESRFLALKTFLQGSKGRKSFSLPMICILLMAIFGSLSVILSEGANIQFSLFGSTVRGEGLFTLFSYYMIFFSVCFLYEEEYRRTLLLFFVGFGFFVTIMALIQVTGIYSVTDSFKGWACSPMQNPNFFASFSVLFTGISITAFLYYKDEIKLFKPFRWMSRWIWYALSLMGFLSCISAFSSVAYVGLIMMFLMLIMLEIIQKQKRIQYIILLFVGLIGMMICLNFVSKGRVFSEFLSIGKQIEESGSLFADEVGSYRMLIYKNSIKLIPSYVFFGCGVENLEQVYTERFGQLSPGIVCDRAHNEYLHMWITEGVFAIAAYLVFLFALFIPMIKKIIRQRKEKDESESFYLRVVVFVAFFGYIAQAFFNISVIQVAPYFWMFCGLLYQKKEKRITF